MSIKSILSTIVSGIYFVTNVAALHATESNFWAERRRGIQNKSGSPMLMAGLPSAQTSIGTNFLQQFPSIDRHALAPSLSATVTKTLPSNFTVKNASLLQALSTSYGSIRKITLPSSSQIVPSRTVVHIQDVHQNADAQKNIGQVVQSLVDHDQVGLVALEGAFHSIDLSGFRSFSRQDVLKKWADYLLRTNRISGPIYSALTGAKSFPTIAGIDDPTHYNANVEAYRSSAPRMQEYKGKIAALQSILNNKKATLFNPALLAFDRSVQSYSAGKIGLGEHFKTMSDQVPANRLTQVTKDFLKALAMESTINFQQVEKDRTQLVERLVQRLDKKQTDTLIQWSVAYRAGQVRYAEFYRSLKDLCENNGLPLARFPAMNEYIRYVLLADGIDPEQLLTDMTALEKSAYAHLIKTPEEKQIAERSNALTLTGKLVDFSLTPVEYEEYVKSSLPDFSKNELSMFENFYKQAHARDQSMTDNLLKSMVANKTDTAVLVTGGFHSPGMAEKLQRAGFTIISFTPKIEKIDTSQGSAYLSVFSQEKTPLEKMFQGHKLFLAQNPVDGLNAAPAELPAGVVATQFQNGIPRAEIERDMEEVLTELKGHGLAPADVTIPGFEVKQKGESIEVSVNVKSGDSVRKVRYTARFDKEGGYYQVDSADEINALGRAIETASEIAPVAAQLILQRTTELFGQGHGEHIAELPIFGNLPDMGLGNLLWVLNLHKMSNVNPADLVARIVKMEMLRQLSQLIGSEQLSLTPDGIPEWEMNPSHLLATSLVARAYATLHFMFNFKPDGALRPGRLAIDQETVLTVNPHEVSLGFLDQNIFTRPPVRNLKGMGRVSLDKDQIRTGLRLGMIVTYRSRGGKFYFTEKENGDLYSLADIQAVGTTPGVASSDSQSVPHASEDDRDVPLFFLSVPYSKDQIPVTRDIFEEYRRASALIREEMDPALQALAERISPIKKGDLFELADGQVVRLSEVQLIDTPSPSPGESPISGLSYTFVDRQNRPYRVGNETLRPLRDVTAGTATGSPLNVPPVPNQQVPSRERQQLYDEQSAALDVVEQEIQALWNATAPAVSEMMGRLYTINRRIQKIQEGDNSFDDLVTRGKKLDSEVKQINYYLGSKDFVQKGFTKEFPGIYLMSPTGSDIYKYSLDELQDFETRFNAWHDADFASFSPTKLDSSTINRLRTEFEALFDGIRQAIPKRRAQLVEEAHGRIGRLESLHKNIAEGNVLNAAHVFDIHGDPAILDEVIADVEAGRVQQVIFHGDAFDRGANNLGVFDRFKKLKDLLGDRFVMILGNHDVWMIEALLMNDDQAMANWLLNGGDAVFKEAGFNRDFAQMVREGRNAGTLPARFDYLRNDPRMKPLLEIAGWMLANQKLFHVDDRGFMHIHAGIPMDADGKPRVNRQQLEAAQEKLRALQSSLVVGQALRFNQRTGLAEIFEEMKGIFWIREEGWLDRILTQPGGALKIDAQHQDEVDQIKALLINEIRRQMPVGETMPDVQMDAIVNQHLPTALAQFNIPYEVVKPKADPDKLQKLLDAFDIQGIMFGHNHHAQVQNVDARIIGADVDQNVFVRADARGVRVRDMRKSKEETLIDREAILSRLQSQIDALRQKAGVSAAQSPTAVAVIPQKTEHALPSDDEPKTVGFSKEMLASTFQQVRWVWGGGAFSIHARVSTQNPSLVRLSPRIGVRRIETITLREGQSLFVGTLNGDYAFYSGRAMPNGMILSRTLKNESGRITVATAPGASSPTSAQLIPDDVALGTSRINSRQHAADLLARAILSYVFENHQTSSSRVRNTWFRSDVLGYGLFVVVSAALMTFLGVDLETLSSPFKALLLTAAVPLSMVTTSTMGVAAFFELSTRRTDPKAWALKHGVQEGSAKYNAYMESAERIAAAGRAAAAVGKNATWAEIKEQSRLNIEYFMGLFSHQGRPTQGPSTEAVPTAVSTILQMMPDAKKGTFSAADVFGAVTNTGSDLKGIAKNAVQGMSEQTRKQVSKLADALRWLMKVAGINTNAVALLPLPSTLMDHGDLNQIVDNALTMHKKAVFYVEADVKVPSAFMKYLESKDHRAEFVRLPGGVKLFDNEELMMVVLEKNSPQNVPNVQPYLPDEYTANDTGVTDEKQFGKKSVLPMSLIIMFSRMIELANFIATQA